MRPNNNEILYMDDIVMRNSPPLKRPPPLLNKTKKHFDSDDYFKRKEEESETRWLRITEGLTLYKNQQFERAQMLFKALLDESFGPNKTQFYRPYADCFRKRHLYYEALRVYNEGYSFYKSSPNEQDRLEFAALVNNRGLTFRALGQYDNAAQDFDEALQNVTTPKRFLYMCNKGHALYLSGQKESALRCIKEAFDFVQKKWYELDDHLAEGQINYIKSRFKEFMGEFNQLQKINLKISDEILTKREDAFILKNIQDLETKGEQPEPEEKDKFIQILDAKEKLKIIHSNAQLYQYYDGFLYTLSQGYAVALVVNSDTLSVSTDSFSVSAVTTLVSLIPLVGEKVSQGMGAAYSFVKEAQVKRAATNVCSFATTISEFETIAQNVVLDSILRRKNEIDDPKLYLLPSWAAKFRNFVQQLNANLYGDRNQTPMQKLGYQTASSLIEKYIASGDIYFNQAPVWILPDEKQRRLLDVSLILLDKNIQEWDKKDAAQEAQAYEAAGQKQYKVRHCCEMF